MVDLERVLALTSPQLPTVLGVGMASPSVHPTLPAHRIALLLFCPTGWSSDHPAQLMAHLKVPGPHPPFHCLLLGTLPAPSAVPVPEPQGCSSRCYCPSRKLSSLWAECVMWEARVMAPSHSPDTAAVSWVGIGEWPSLPRKKHCIRGGGEPLNKSQLRLQIGRLQILID